MSITKKVVSGAMWMSGINYIGFAINFFIQITIVRLLMPVDFGVYAIGASLSQTLFIFFGFSFSMAVIQIKDEPDLFDTAFYLAIFSGITIVIIGIIISVLIIPFYKLSSIFVFLVLCATQPINACTAIYSATKEKELNFKGIAISRGIATNFSGFVAIGLAILNFNVWSLVIRDIITTLLLYIGTKTVTNYRFKWKFNRKTASKIFDFAVKRVFVRGLEIVFFQMPLLIIGTFFGAHQLGLFSQALYLSNLPNTALSPVTNTVAFAAYCNVNDNKEKLSNGFYFPIFFILRIILPVVIVVYLYPSEILQFLYGNKWLGSVIYLKYLSFYMVMLPLFAVGVIHSLSIGKLISTMKIYLGSVFFLFIGVISAIIFKSILLVAVVYPVALVIGLVIIIYILASDEKIYVNLFDLFFFPLIIVSSMIFLVECFSFSNFYILVFSLVLYVFGLIFERKEIIKILKMIRKDVHK